MIHADRRHFLGQLSAIGAVLSLPAPACAQTPFGLGELMSTLALVKAGEATFTERRSVAMLERPLESSGRLWFEAPDTFVRETLVPRRERVAIVGNTMTMSTGSRSRTLPLDSLPEAAVLLEAIRGTLTGNREALEQHFSATVTGDAQHWTLELVPREPRLREQVDSVRVNGQQARVREVAVAMADGDRSVMLIEPLAADAQATRPAAPARSASAAR